MNSRLALRARWRNLGYSRAEFYFVERTVDEYMIRMLGV